jgi:ankyrin repeat protein
MLLDAGATPEHCEAIGASPLFWTQGESVEACELYLKAGGDADFRRSDGTAPLHSAAMRTDDKLTALLLESGADPNAVNLDGRSPLTEVADAAPGRMQLGAAGYRLDVPSRPELRIVRLLLDAGAEVNQVDNAGKTPLIHAAERLDAAMCRLLLDGGADASVRDQEGCTAWDYIRMAREPLIELEALLHEAAADDGASPSDAGG